MCERSTVLGLHFVCLPCRAAVKRRKDALSQSGGTDCTRCGRPMVDAGQDLEVPRRADTQGWRVLAALLDAGVTFHSRCCCGPGWRPRTMAQVKERLTAAERTGVPVARALATEDADAIGSPGERRPNA